MKKISVHWRSSPSTNIFLNSKKPQKNQNQTKPTNKQKTPPTTISAYQKIESDKILKYTSGYQLFTK